MIVSASFNDYLYILIGIAWLAFSVYKGQKKKEANDQGSQVKSKKSFLESLIDEFNPAAASIPVSDTANEALSTVSNDELEYNSEIFSYDDEVEESNETETSVVYRQKEVEKSNKETLEKLEVLDNQKDRTQKVFSLRNAVIYAEILKPRYF